ncbi:alpha-1,3-mannosyl-glycoprotein 4-beta-N-acetylglucosaminyltransferase C-like isoform X2 [Sceloporus undulatus]|uniref:alpha-1,3-mannosyl-glycoprotein 4-beta-N-acetylglucosaminyltransferase C-like isoform X2 n=1 Tax=Sceloporus undulatus TaxID=8520 RepID=UPI001C4D847F|nr:alpha-1,3-mannosyl-glycoprotein 4-beta-N-acetylglucosaminyltransferase C-like isoform X2 [Sceloporus undulatus]
MQMFRTGGTSIHGGKKSIGLDDIIWDKPQNPTLSVMESASGPLPIQYTYLLGSPPTKKRFLTIGISSVYKAKEQNLLKTIESILSHSSLEELQMITLVIYLANNSSQLNEHSAKEIKAKFGEHVNVGRLLVIQSSLASYPPLSSLKADYWNRERMGGRTKQNVDYAYLVNFCAGLSKYYLMLEDDIVCATNFVTIIHNYVNDRKIPWTTIAFSRLGYIGKLYRSCDLIKLARFLFMFYDTLPADWLLEFFHKAKGQENAIFFRPSLFQHIGRKSSFHSMEIELQDPEFEEEFGPSGDFPTASCFTNIPIFSNYVPNNVCPPGKGVFWGKNVTAESFFTIVFAHPIVPQKIQIYTGSAEFNRDILYYGYVEKGRLKIHSHGSQTCLTFQRIGDFKNGRFEMEDRDNDDDIDCLRIQATAPQKQWLRIRKINIWVKNN